MNDLESAFRGNASPAHSRRHESYCTDIGVALMCGR
jgi:hypothetical protein